MFRALRLLLILSSVLLVTACNSFATPFFHFSLLSVSSGGSVTCPLVRFRAEFAGEVVRNADPVGPALDGSWVADVGEGDGLNLIGFVGATSGWPRRGAPFEVQVDCLDEAQELIGVSRFRGHLLTPGRSSSVRVLNYPSPPGSPPCSPPTQGSGVSLCAEVDGFSLD